MSNLEKTSWEEKSSAFSIEEWEIVLSTCPGTLLSKEIEKRLEHLSNMKNRIQVLANEVFSND